MLALEWRVALEASSRDTVSSPLQIADEGMALDCGAGPDAVVDISLGMPRISPQRVSGSSAHPAVDAEKNNKVNTRVKF